MQIPLDHPEGAYSGIDVDKYVPHTENLFNNRNFVRDL